MDPASILAFLTFASTTSDLILKTTKTIHQAPVEILSLNNELNDLQLVLIELQSFQKISKDSLDLAGSIEHFDIAFEKCFDRIRQLFEQISEVTASVFAQHNGRYTFERLTWMRRKSSLLKLKGELTAVRQTLRDLIEARTASRVTRIEVALNQISATAPSNVAVATIYPEASSKVEPCGTATPVNIRSSLHECKNSLRSFPPSSTVAFETSRKAQCDIRCPCPCHVRFTCMDSSLLGSLFGSLFVGYIGIPALNSTCRLGACYSSSVRAYRILYTFPVWFLERTLEIAFGSNYFGEPEFNIRVHNRIEYTLEGSLFQLARKGDVDAMQKKLTHRQASPHDLSLRGGLSAFDVSRQPHLLMVLANNKVIVGSTVPRWYRRY